jgi:transposase-like protein
MTKRTNKSYPNDFKQEAVSLVTEQGYSVVEAAALLNITDKLLYNSVAKFKEKSEKSELSTDERAELIQLRKDKKRLQMEREILKKASAFFAKEMKYSFITSLGKQYPVTMWCRVMLVSKSAYYAWCKRPAHIISAQTLNLHRGAKVLFTASRDSLGSRELGKNFAKKALK